MLMLTFSKLLYNKNHSENKFKFQIETILGSHKQIPPSSMEAVFCSKITWFQSADAAIVNITYEQVSSLLHALRLSTSRNGEVSFTSRT